MYAVLEVISLFSCCVLIGVFGTDYSVNVLMISVGQKHHFAGTFG